MEETKEMTLQLCRADFIKLGQQLRIQVKELNDSPDSHLAVFALSRTFNAMKETASVYQELLKDFSETEIEIANLKQIFLLSAASEQLTMKAVEHQRVLVSHEVELINQVEEILSDRTIRLEKNNEDSTIHSCYHALLDNLREILCDNS